MKYFLLLVFLVYSPIQLYSDSPKCAISKASENGKRIKIKNFFIKDFTRNLFLIQLSAYDYKYLFSKLTMKKNKEKKKEIINYTKLYVSINDGLTEPVPMSYKLNGPYLDFELIPQKNLKDQKGLCIGLYSEESLAKGLYLDTVYYELPDSLSNAGEQPLIYDINPGAGVIGDTITIRGKKLGERVEDIKLYVLSENKGSSSGLFVKEDNVKGEVYPFDDFSMCYINPFYLSRETPIGNSDRLVQELKFTIPPYIDDKNRCFEDNEFSFSDIIFGKKIRLKLISNARPSTIEDIRFLHKKWKVFYAIISIVIILLFIVLLSFLMKKVHFLPDILLDPATNSYALANLQSYIWTIVLLGSYLYVALCQWTILVDKISLPDFNAKLTALLGISFGGSIISSFIQKGGEQIIPPKEKPEWIDLISDPLGGIDVSKLQLLGFTIITVIIYLLYLAKCNPLNGLPDIPETLHGLLGVSQMSYLATKAVDKKDNSPKKVKNEPKEMDSSKE